MKATSENIVDTINKAYSHLTRSEKRIADFVYANPLEVQYMSITNFAEQCRVADATIFRFCKSLGLSGYNSFKLALAKSSTYLENQPSRAEDQDYVPLYGKVSPGDTFTEMCDKLYTAEMSAIAQTRQLLNEDAIARAAKILKGARRVYCMGQGSSLIIAMDAWCRFVSVSPNFFCVEDSHMQTVATSLLDENDAILFFSYSGATKDMPDILRPAKEQGVKIVLVTHYTKSPASGFADVILQVESNEGPHQQGSIAAKMAQLFVIDVLFNQFWRLDPETCKRNCDITSMATAGKLL